MAPAVTEGCRVTGLVTATPSRMVKVAAAARPSSTYGSPTSVWLSANKKPW